MRDAWRRRLDALNEGGPVEPPSHSLPLPAEPRATARSRILERIGVGASIAMVVVGLILAFPLAWERKAHSCSALESLLARQTYQWAAGAGAPSPALTMMPNAEVPAWFRCYLIYWRRLEVKPVSGDALLQFARGLHETHAIYLVGAGLALAVLGTAILIRRRRFAAVEGEDAFSVLGVDRAAASESAAPPVDLSKAITGADAWKAVRTHAKDAAYLRAVETLRLRYQMVSNQMLLPNTLREVMTRSGVTFREAVIRVAEDDGIGGRR